MLELQNKISTIIDTITTQYPKTLAIYLFGSTVTGKTNTTSDIDLAVLFEDPVNSYTLWNTAQDLAISLNQDVDLIDLKQASTVLAFEIIHSSKLIYCKDKDTVSLFENRIYAEYLRLQERLVDLYQAAKERGGIIYGQCHC